MSIKLRQWISLAFLATILLSYQNCSKGFVLVEPLEELQFKNEDSIADQDPRRAPADAFMPPEADPPPSSPLPPFQMKPYQTQPLTSSFALVYIRIPRVTEAMDYRDSAGVMHLGTRNWDVMQKLPETAVRLSGMAGPGQLVYRDRNGQEKILFDCMSTGDCLPMDPTVSFDGKKVIFSVLYGQFKKVFLSGQTYPYNQLENPKEAVLMIADIATGQITRLPHPNGAFDTGPVFLLDRNIMFTSNRSNELGSSNFFLTANMQRVLQLWIVDANGLNPRRVGPHDRDDVLHPFVMQNGRVLFSTWQISGQHLYGQNNGSIGGPGTAHNKFWLASVDHTGGHWSSVLGAHGHEMLINGNRRSFKALHFVTETSSGWLCTTDYYRGNNFGSGAVLCWQQEATDIEGRGPGEKDSTPNTIFTPRNMLVIAPWATSSDEGASVLNDQVTGKLRDPMALPGNQLLLTFMRGHCFGVGWEHLEKIQSHPFGCDGGIYQTSTIPIASPDSLVKIVDDPNWHEFMGRVAEPYSFIYGKEKPELPALQRDARGRCILASSSMEAEIDPIKPYNFFDATDCATQGCKMRAIPANRIRALRFWEALPNSNLNGYTQKVRSTIGRPQKLLGDVPLNKDGSFAVELPCDTPYVMAGVDEDGNAIVRDQVVQSLRPGEIRTCTGCHLHSRPGRPFSQSLAASQLASPFRLGGEKIPNMQKGWWVPDSKVVADPEFKRDIWPVLQNRCLSCHSGITAAKGLRFDIPGTSLYNNTQPELTSTWWRLAWDSGQFFVEDRVSYHPTQPTVFALEKPHTSKYVHATFAAESLLLWKTTNKRIDGRKDEDFPLDIDFGPSHPTSATEDEIRLIRDWIDSGAFAEQP